MFLNATKQGVNHYATAHYYKTLSWNGTNPRNHDTRIDRVVTVVVDGEGCVLVSCRSRDFWSDMNHE